MSQTIRPEDIIAPAMGKDLLNQTKGLVEGGDALKKGDTVTVTKLSFDASRGQGRAGKVTRAAHPPVGVMHIVAADVPVGRTAILVKTLPFQMDTTGAAEGDPTYVGANGEPVLADPGAGSVKNGVVVTVGTVAAGGAVMLSAPGLVTN